MSDLKSALLEHMQLKASIALQDEVGRISNENLVSVFWLSRAIRNAFQIEYMVWEASDFFDGTRHFAVLRKGETLWHTTYNTHEDLIDIPAWFLQSEIRTAGKGLLDRLIAAEHFEEYWD